MCTLCPKQLHNEVAQKVPLHGVLLSKNGMGRQSGETIAALFRPQAQRNYFSNNHF